MKTCISCELDLDPDPNPESLLQRWSGLRQVVSPPTFHICPITCASHAHSVDSGQRDDCGCQSTDPIRRIKRKSLGLCPLKDCHYSIHYMWVYSVCVWFCEGSEKACDWGTWRLSECIPKGQNKIPQGMWTSALNDTRQDPQAGKHPRAGVQQKDSRLSVSDRKKQVKLAISGSFCSSDLIFWGLHSLRMEKVSDTDLKTLVNMINTIPQSENLFLAYFNLSIYFY